MLFTLPVAAWIRRARSSSSLFFVATAALVYGREVVDSSMLAGLSRFFCCGVIDDLGIEGEWTTLTWTGLTNTEVVITFSSNSGTETLMIDNVVWEGEAIPAPGALALLGLAGIVSRRRRA